MHPSILILTYLVNSVLKQVVTPKLQELAQCSGFNRRMERGGGRYGGGGGGGGGRFSGGGGRYYFWPQLPILTNLA